MRLRRRQYQAVIFVSFLGFLCATTTLGHCTNLTMALQASPDPVARGALLTYAVTLENTGANPETGLILEGTLPTGLDQWTAQYSVNGSGWLPHSGSIIVGTVNGNDTVTIAIRATVEVAAPAQISKNTVTVRKPSTGPLASATLQHPINVLPLVDAGANKMADLGGTVALSDAAAGDGGGGIASYSWTDNGAGGHFDDASSLHPIYTAPGLSDLVNLTLTVADHQGGQGSDSLLLRVNAFPTVDAGPDRSDDEGTTIALNDATANDTDGWITAYSWSDNGAGGAFSPSSTVMNPSYTLPTTQACNGEDVTLTLAVTDNWGAQASDSRTLHVHNVNHLPVANAGSDSNVQEKEQVTLLGSGSDSDGLIVEFSWEQTSGPSVTLRGENTDQVSFTAPQGNTSMTLQFKLTVTDDCGGSGNDEVTVIVEPISSPQGAISVEKQADRTSAMLGEVITYTYTVTNTGAGTLFAVSATDDKLGDVTLSSDTLTPGEVATGTAAAVVTEHDFPGPLVSTVTATGTDETGAVITARAIASVGLTSARPSIAVLKEAQDHRGFAISPLSSLAIGETITYVYSVTNTGEAVLTNLSAMDNQLGKVPLGKATLAPWEKTSGTLSKVITQQDLPGPLENTVTVTATDPSGAQVTDSDTVSLLEISFETAIELIKDVEPTEAEVGDTLTYTYTITNTGDVTFIDLELADDQLGAITLPEKVLGPGERLTVTAEYVVTEADLPGPLSNSARISGNSPLGEKVATETTASVSLLSEVAGGGGGVIQDENEERVIISEIAWAGTPASPDDEWIELCNLGSRPVDLTGWQLCWYPKGPTVPDRYLWRRIALSGIISASPIELSRRRWARPQITFLKGSEDAFSWLVFDMSWWVAGKDGQEGRGYYILERKHDETVSNVTADLIYDVQPPYLFKLPDDGAVLVLLNADGEVVDTANAVNAKGRGWTAGNMPTRATMERSNLLTGDVSNNWHTNPGIVVCGIDAAGNRIAATPGKPNSPDLGELTHLANTEVSAYRVREETALTLEQAEWEAHPWMCVTGLELDVAGGGGAVQPSLAFSSRKTHEGYQLAFETANLPSGIYYIWITNKEGEAILVPIDVAP